ncbi:MAG: Ig-like domain-containing protein [Candidatus Sulfotelmatobacter sp.]
MYTRTLWLALTLVCICTCALFLGSCSNHHLVSIAITPHNPSIAQVGQTTQFMATGTTNDTKTPPSNITSTATWSSSASSVATINSSGLATATGCGSTTITATQNGVVGSTQLTVSCTNGGGGGTPVLQSINIYPNAPSIPQVGQTTQFIALGAYSPASGNNNLTGSATWASSDGSIATVNTSGLATAVSCGTTTITAQFQGVLGQTQLTVACTVNPNPVLQSITLYPSNPIIPQLQQTTQFIAIALYSPPSNNNLLTNVATWASSNTAVATISASGLATAQACGATTITAQYQGVVGQMGLAVQCTGSQTLSSIQVLPSNPSISQIGQSSQFAALGTLTQGGQIDITQTATWSSSDTQVATVSSAGLATAVSCGTTTIQAESQNVAGTSTLTVSCTSVPAIELVVIKQGTPGATIVSNPLGINCGTICGALYNEGTGITLTATTPATSWQNCDQVSVDQTMCYLTLVPDPNTPTQRTVTASF